MKKFFSNLKMTPKLIAAFVVVVIVSSISGIIGMVMLKNVDSQYSKALVENGFVQGDIGRFESMLYKATKQLQEILF